MAPQRTERHQISSFLDLGVDADLVQRLQKLGIARPLPIQVAAIPPALAGRDVFGQAPTGCGKTLAFGLPLLSASSAKPGMPRALVLVPTRELAEQVRLVLSSLLGARSHRVAAVYGGVAYNSQLRDLRRGVEIVVACPGRLEDLIARGHLSLAQVRTVVLDEADRMVDMGFVQPVCRLVDQTAPGRQLLLFSATLGPEVSAISRRYQRDPERCQVTANPAGDTDVVHHFWRAEASERVSITAEVIAQYGQTFVFCRTKRGADRVARQLRALGVRVEPIHGDRSQLQRAKALNQFASRQLRALVATDVVARGIHVDDVPCVVHFDLPPDADSYLHRSGRTGRAGNTGTVISLVPVDGHAGVRALQRNLGYHGQLTRPFSSAPTKERTRAAVAEPTSKRWAGTVKFYDSRRGFGFIAASDGTEVFVHQSKLVSSDAGSPKLHKGGRVVFDVTRSSRGHEAHNVAVAP